MVKTLSKKDTERGVSFALSVDCLNFLLNFEEASATGQAIAFERWGDGKADGFGSATLVGDNKMSGERIESPLLAFYRSLERFEIDCCKHALHGYIIMQV